MDTEAVRKRRPVWKIVLGFFGILAGIFILFLIWLLHLSERRWQDMEVRVKELQAEYKARIGPRPVLHGTATPGSAWDDYLPAMATIRGIGVPKAQTLRQYIDRHKPDRAAVEALLEEHGALLEGLKAGAARTEGQYPHDWMAWMTGGGPNIYAAQLLAQLAVCRVRFLREAGAHLEATHLLLDIAQFGRDLGDNGPLLLEMQGIALLSFSFAELRDRLIDKSLPADEAAAISRGLDPLDQNFPSHAAAMLNEPLVWGSTLLHGDTNFFPAHYPRLLISQTFFTSERMMRTAAQAESQSWQSVQEVDRRSQDEIDRSWNPLHNLLLGGVLSSSRPGRERRAQLRLLRMAAAQRSGGQIPELDDPFGAKLRHATVGDKLRFWSVGADGVDDGGTKGAWKAPNTGDLILEIER